jgi:hypothetical protein
VKVDVKGQWLANDLNLHMMILFQLVPLHLPEGDISTSRTVQVIGNKQQIEAAQEMINDLISEVCITKCFFFELGA